MKFIEYSGCITGGYTVDGRDLNDLSQEEIDSITDYLLAKIKEMVQEKELDLFALVRLFDYDDFKSSDEPCDQCNDYSSETIYKI